MDKPNPKARRSSILKLPRQKYSDEEQEESTAIESTIARNKRRVSFASSNFVKPFVSDPDQNTIWDTTYEEAVDHTNSTRSSQDIASIQSVNETGSIAKDPLDDDDVEMMDIDEDINNTLLDTTQHVDFTNMSLEEMEITNVADKENIIPVKCHRGSIVDFAKKLDSLQSSCVGDASGDAKREPTCQNSRNIYFAPTGQGFEMPILPMDHPRKSFDILHHTTSFTENIYQGPVESIKPTVVTLKQVSNISIGRHQRDTTRQFGTEKLSASSGQIQANCSIGSALASTSLNVETDQNASLLPSDSMSSMDLTCEDQDIELGKLLSDSALKTNLNQTDMEFTCQIPTEQRKSLAKDMSSMELTCQIPTDAEQKPTVDTKPIGQDLSSMELTCQIPLEQRKSYDLSNQITNQRRKSIARDPQSMQIPTDVRRSNNNNQSLKESRTESEQSNRYLSSMEFTCQISSEHRKSLCSDPTSTKITSQEIKSVGNDLSSTEITCQNPSDARRSINKPQSLQESRTENVLAIDQDLSSMEFTCQIPSDSRRSINKNQSLQESRSENIKSIDKSLSSMEFTCQIPNDSRRSIDKHQSLQESRTENIKSVDSSMEFTCQIPNDARKSINKHQSLLQESRTENVQAIDQDLSSMEFTCQIPTDSRRSINKHPSLQESRTENIKLIDSSLEFTCQIPNDVGKSINKHQTLQESRTENIKSVDSSMEFTCQIPNDARKSINKPQSLQESRTENVLAIDQDTSSMEFTCQIPNDSRRSINKHQSLQESRTENIKLIDSSMEFTCQIPNDARKSINKPQSLQESRTENVLAIDQDTSSMEFTCQIPNDSRRSINKHQSLQESRTENIKLIDSSMEFTCQIPNDARKSINKHQSLQESRTENVQVIDQDLSSMEFTCQIPTDSRRSINKHPSLQESRTENIKLIDSSLEFTCQIPNDVRKSINKHQSLLQESRTENVQTIDQDISSMEFTCQVPIDSRRSINKHQSLQESRTENIKLIDSSMEFTCQIPNDARKSTDKHQSLLQESGTGNVHEIDQNLSSMEFTCQIPTVQNQSLGNNLSSISQRKSLGKDFSSLEFSCQIPTTAGISISKNESLKELQTENVQPVDLDLSSMEFTCQIPSEQRKSLGNSLPSIQTTNGGRKSTVQDLSSMEFTSQISSVTPDRMSHNNDQSLQKSVCQMATESIKPTDHDLSTREFTREIPSEPRKSIDKNSTSVLITNQMGKSTAQDLSTMELSSQIQTSFKKDQSLQQSVRKLPTGQDVSSLEFIGQIPVDKMKSIDKDRSTAEFSGPSQTANRMLTDNDLSSIVVTRRVSSQNRKSLDKNQSALEITRSFHHNMPSTEFNYQLPTDNRKPTDQNQSLMEHSNVIRKSTDQNPLKSLIGEIPNEIRRSIDKNQSLKIINHSALDSSCQLATGNSKSPDQDISSTKLTCQIPVEKRKSIERSQSTTVCAGQNEIENRKSVDKDLSSMEDTVQLPIDKRKSSDQNSLKSVEITRQIPSEMRKSVEKNQSLEFTDQLLPSEIIKPVKINMSSMNCTFGMQTEDEHMEVDSPKRSTYTTNISSMNFTSTCAASTETCPDVKHNESKMEIVPEHTQFIEETNPLPEEDVKSSNSRTCLIEKPVTVEVESQNKTLEKHEKSAIWDSSICDIPTNVPVESLPKLEDSIGKSENPSNIETSVLDTNKGCIDDTMSGLTHRRIQFTSSNPPHSPLERSVISTAHFVDDDTKNNLFLTASSQPKVDDCKNEDMKATNILYSQQFSGPKLSVVEKPISEVKNPTTSFHMTLTPNLTMLDSQVCNLTNHLTTADNIDLNDTSFIPQLKKVMRISFPSMIHDDSDLLDHFKCSLIDENDHMNSDTSEIEQDNKLMHVNDTYVLKTKSNVTHDKMNTEMVDALCEPDKTFAKTDQLLANGRSLNRTDQTISKTDEIFSRSGETFAKNDRTFVRSDQTFAKSDKTFVTADRTLAKSDRTFVTADQTFAKSDQTVTKSDQTVVKNYRTFVRTGQTLVKNPTDVELETKQSCQEPQRMKASSKNSEAFKRCYNLLSNFKASMNILQDGNKLDFNIVDNDDDERENGLLLVLDNSLTSRPKARKKIVPKLHTFSSTKASPDKSLRKILHEQRLQIKSYLENFEFKPFNLLEVETKSGEDTSDGTFENVTEEMSADLMSLSINENKRNPVDFTQEILKLEKKASGFWNLEKVDGHKYYFSTLHGCLQFNVDFDQTSGVVNNLQLKRNLPDSAHPYAHYVFHLMHEKLSNPSLSSAIGNKYDILSLLEYVHLMSTKSLKFHQEYERMKEDGLVIRNMTATFTIIDIKLRIWWTITVDLQQGKLVDLDAKRGTDLLKSKAADIYNMVKICPKGFDFLFTFINSVKAHFKI